MKVKVLALIAMSALSISAFAQDGNVETNAMVNFENAPQLSADYSTTRTDNASGSLGQTIKIKTYHSFNVTNDSGSMKNYLVAETCKVNGKEYKKGWGFSLPPHGNKSFSENAYLDYPANERGSWKIESMTCVGNSSACSFDHATLTVN
jgi:hypothetical protein